VATQNTVVSQENSTGSMAKPLNHLEQVSELVLEVLATTDDTPPTEFSDNDNDLLASRRPTVLLIDDDAVDRRAIERMLKMQYFVVSASSGEEGLAIFKEIRPDCVIVDYNLPDTSGIAVVGNLKKYDPHAGVIMLTGQGDEIIAAEAMRYGAYYYISKDNVSSDILNHFITNAMIFTHSQRKNSVQKLLLENYTSVLAHEIIAPLETIRRYLRHMRTDSQTTLSERSVAAIGAMNNIIDTLQKTTQHFSDYTTLENFNNEATCSLSATVETALENLAFKAHHSQLEVTYDHLPGLSMNRWKCLLIVQNLIDVLMNVIVADKPASCVLDGGMVDGNGVITLRLSKSLFNDISLKTMRWLQDAPYFESGFHEYSIEYAPFMLVRAIATYCKDELRITELADDLLLSYHFTQSLAK
tara:strand:- start:2006 stop:3247 length:1242 start_codon:yes stop_codon:yes gene_type:complete